MKKFERKVDIRHGWFKCPICSSRIELARMNTTIYGENKTFFSQNIECDMCGIKLYGRRDNYVTSYVEYNLYIYNSEFYNIFIKKLLPKLKRFFI